MLSYLVLLQFITSQPSLYRCHSECSVMKILNENENAISFNRHLPVLHPKVFQGGPPYLDSTVNLPLRRNVNNWKLFCKYISQLKDKIQTN